MKIFKISLKMTKRGCQMKVCSKYRHYYRYFSTMEGAEAYAKFLAVNLKSTHQRCESISLFVDGQYKTNLLDVI